jgi:hypothetical protein
MPVAAACVLEAERTGKLRFFNEQVRAGWRRMAAESAPQPAQQKAGP